MSYNKPDSNKITMVFPKDSPGEFFADCFAKATGINRNQIETYNDPPPGDYYLKINIDDEHYDSVQFKHTIESSVFEHKDQFMFVMKYLMKDLKLPYMVDIMETYDAWRENNV